MIKWAGISNEDVGMIVEHYPKVIVPTRKIETIKVPGRNGNILLDDGSFENYNQEYSVFLDVKHVGGLEAAMPTIIDWLLGHSGYQRLEDSYFPDVYRMASYAGGSQFVSVFNEYGEGVLTFNCCPEKFFKIGERAITLSKNQKVINPTLFTAKPLYKLKGSGTCRMTVNGTEVTVNNVSEYVMIDAAARRVYKDTTRLNNNFVGEFESLYLGKENVITWRGGTTGIELIPRWWTI